MSNNLKSISRVIVSVTIILIIILLILSTYAYFRENSNLTTTTLITPTTLTATTIISTTTTTLISPVLISPGLSYSLYSPGKIIDTLTPIFQWNEVPNADFYGLYIRDIEADKLVFNSENENIRITGNSYKLPTGILEWGKPYCWNMRSHSATGWSEYSKSLCFFTGVPGIDVSYHNGIIEWDKVALEGYKFAFIKATTGIGNKLLPLNMGDEGEIIYHEKNGISKDNYTWWYVRIRHDNIDYVGWIAREWIEKVGSGDLTIGDKIRIISNNSWLRSTPGISKIPYWDDRLFIRNIENAIKNGLLVGIYHFACPNLYLSGEALNKSAEEEAIHFLEVTQNYLKKEYQILTPALDIEDDGIKLATGKESIENIAQEIGLNEAKKRLTQWIITWMETIEKEKSIKPILYVNSKYAQNYIDRSIAEKYELWFARPYVRYPTETIWAIGVWNNWSFWQYSWTGSIPGIKGNVDLDVFNGNLEKLKTLKI